jgi:hypothetical protein
LGVVVWLAIDRRLPEATIKGQTKNKKSKFRLAHCVQHCVGKEQRIGFEGAGKGASAPPCHKTISKHEPVQ